MRSLLALSLSALILTPACAPTSEDEQFYTEEWDLAFSDGKDDSVRIGRFETFTGRDGRAYFHLLAGNGQKVLHSQGYTTMSGAFGGIDSVRNNGADVARFRLLEAVSGQFYFNLVAGNGRVIGTSELYATRSNAERGIATVASLVKAANEQDAVERAAFQVFRGLDLQYYFHVRAGNGQIVLQSQGYTRRTSAIAGTSSVRTNGANLGRYQIRDAANGEAYFVLTATNGQVIGVSETYASRANAERAVEAVADLFTNIDIAPAQ